MYIVSHPGIVWEHLLQHLYMTAVSLAAGFAIALPLGRFILNRPRLYSLVMGVLGVVYTVPSIALLVLLLPIFGLNATTVIVALIIYVQIILVRNVVAGLRAIDPSVIETARGMGMSAWQLWWRVEFPLALPVTLAGLRIATLAAIAIATIGAMVGAGGLGALLFEGIAEMRLDKIWAGAISVSALALVANALIRALERAFDPTIRARGDEERALRTSVRADRHEPA